MRVNISGCTNSCGQHHISDIGFFGLERRAHGRAAPGYQMLLGGHLGETEVRVRRQGHEGAGQDRARSRRAGRAPVQRGAPGRRDVPDVARPFRRRRRASATRSKELDHFPTPDVGPEFYVDYDETGPYVAEVGDGECAAT